MRDQRESTSANGARRDADGELASRLPKTLGARLRAARMATGLSQGSVATAMAERGFSWRQTTVAKSEAADRPVLFAEVAALAQMYRRPLEYFLYPGTELDSLLDQAASELKSLAVAIDEAQKNVEILRKDMRLYECNAGLLHALVRYRNSSDGGLLLNDLQFLLREYGRLVLEMDDAFESIGLTEEQVSAIDDDVLTELATADDARYRKLSEEDLQWESPELLNNLSAMAAREEVDDSFVDFMRTATAWPDYVGVQLASLVLGAIDRQRPATEV
ncbi:hypothetical protein ACFXAW_21810 [Streptomyces sp. NPDC059445]|uniref:hypothetical protein n=1 Tax=Streptomyces sp. NPDC059445 TaxID=3346832 RepID=UPI003679640C